MLERELGSRTSGSRYFTFNVFNVRLDFDQRVAIVEDELQPEDQESVGLDEFRSRLAR